jgi:hypothetical protein
MKKRLEADLVSIAHRILQLKNKSDVNQLFLETQKLYEKLSVLRFVNEHYGATKPTITHAKIEKEIEDLYDKSADLPIATIIKMAGFVPIAVVPAEGTIIELGASKEISAEEVFVQKPAATAKPNENEVSAQDEELTAEDVDDLGEFAADIVEQPLKDIEVLEEEAFTIEIETEEIPRELYNEAAKGKIADKETHGEELATEDVTGLGDFAADIAEQPLEDIEASEEGVFTIKIETEEIPQKIHNDAAEGKIVDKETHGEEFAKDDVTDLGDFAADIAEQPLENIEASEEEVATIEIETKKIPQEFHNEVTEGKIVNKEEVTTADANDLGDFDADNAKQPLEDIEPSARETEEVTVPTFNSAFELTQETGIEIPKKLQIIQISFEDLLGGPYSEPDFVKVDEIEALPPETLFEAVEKIEKKKTPPAYAPPKITESKTVSLNDKFSKGIDIDLNDRIAFVKHLFGNSSEDYNRVLNQLITFDNFYETRSFIEEMVKPDYNNWKGKDDYAERFMDIIEKKFL